MSLKREFQVGVLFLVGLVLLTVFSITISRLEVFHRYHYLRVIFDSAGGLKKGDQVQVSGVELGSVHSLKLLENTKVKVKLKLHQEIKLYEDYDIRIEEFSMVGGNYVYIAPGTPGENEISQPTLLKGRLVIPGLEKIGEVAAESKEDIKELLQDISTFVKKLSQSEGSLNKFLNDKDLYINLKETSESLKNITKQIEEGNESVSKLLFGEKLSQQLSQAGDAALQILDPVVKTRVFAGAESKYYAESRMYLSKAYITIFPRETRYFLIGASSLSLNRKGEVDYEYKVTRDKDQVFWKAEVQLAYSYSLGRDSLFTFRTGLLEGKLGAGLDFEIPVTATGVVPVTVTIEGRDAYNSVADEDIDENLSGGLFRAYATVRFGKHFRVYAGASRLFNEDTEFMAGLCFQYLDEDIKNFVTLIGLSR